jgi:ribose transport system ATP-binding protein
VSEAGHDTSDRLIEAVGVTKHYGGEVALDGVDFDLRRGEIHALLGENGAGKSTLIKILAGVVQRDRGEIKVAGEELPRHLTPAIVRSSGVAFVHQSLGLLDNLSVAENIALATGYGRRGGLIDFRATERRVGELLREIEVEIDPRSLVAELPQDQKVMVAVARALSIEAKAIVLDEVSSSLPAPQVARLAEGLKAARRHGNGYIYVTHRIDEVFDFADRLTVLRDGKRIATAEVSKTSHDRVVGDIIGDRDFKANSRRSGSGTVVGKVKLEVRGLRGGSLTAPIDFDLRAGEILGMCGLVGSGSQDVAAILGGRLHADEGTADFEGIGLKLGNPRRLRAAGCNYVPGDRQAAGGVFPLSVRDNLFLTRRGRGPDRDPRTTRPRRERRDALELIERYDVRPRNGVEKPLLALSGGNQQKVIVGRAMRGKPKLLVVDDPTAGVDIGSRAQIHQIIRASARSGVPVLVASTDFEEIAELVDRAFVFSRGRLHAEIAGDELDADHLAEASYGVVSEVAS